MPAAVHRNGTTRTAATNDPFGPEQAAGVGLRSRGVAATSLGSAVSQPEQFHELRRRRIQVRLFDQRRRQPRLLAVTLPAVSPTELAQPLEEAGLHPYRESAPYLSMMARNPNGGRCRG